MLSGINHSTQITINCTLGILTMPKLTYRRRKYKHPNPVRVSAYRKRMAENRRVMRALGWVEKPGADGWWVPGNKKPSKAILGRVSETGRGGAETM